MYSNVSTYIPSRIYCVVMFYNICKWGVKISRPRSVAVKRRHSQFLRHKPGVWHQDNATPFYYNAHLLIRLNSDYHIYTLYASAKVAC